jgi:hypothetical protein
MLPRFYSFYIRPFFVVQVVMGAVATLEYPTYAVVPEFLVLRALPECYTMTADS